MMLILSSLMVLQVVVKMSAIPPITNRFTQGPYFFYKYGLTLIQIWIYKYIRYNKWDEISYPFLRFNGSTVEV